MVRRALTGLALAALLAASSAAATGDSCGGRMPGTPQDSTSAATNETGLWKTAHQRGRDQLSRGELTAAAASYDEAYRLKTDSVELLWDMVTIHRLLELPHLARFYLGSLERLAPADAAVNSTLGLLLLKDGRTDEAEIQFRIALLKDGADPVARTWLERLEPPGAK